jgi:hypothetical protein
MTKPLDRWNLSPIVLKSYSFAKIFDVRGQDFLLPLPVYHVKFLFKPCQQQRIL